MYIQSSAAITQSNLQATTIGAVMIQDSRFKHRLFRRNTDIHIYITIMDTLQNMFLNGNII